MDTVPPIPIALSIIPEENSHTASDANINYSDQSVTYSPKLSSVSVQTGIMAPIILFSEGANSICKRNLAQELFKHNYSKEFKDLFGNFIDFGEDLDFYFWPRILETLIVLDTKCIPLAIFNNRDLIHLAQEKYKKVHVVHLVETQYDTTNSTFKNEHFLRLSNHGSINQLVKMFCELLPLS
jgi:hypothetical protein